MGEFEGRPTMCDHCGTPTKAMTMWPAEVVESCQCWCHVRRSEKRDSGKKKKKS